VTYFKKALKNRRRYEQRWVDAWNIFEKKNPEAKPWIRVIVNSLIDKANPIFNLYNGRNEEDIIDLQFRCIKEMATGIFRCHPDLVASPWKTLLRLYRWFFKKPMSRNDIILEMKKEERRMK